MLGEECGRSNRFALISELEKQPDILRLTGLLQSPCCV
jgi:hypothetical protein